MCVLAGFAAAAAAACVGFNSSRSSGGSRHTLSRHARHVVRHASIGNDILATTTVAAVTSTAVTVSIDVPSL